MNAPLPIGSASAGAYNDSPVSSNFEVQNGSQRGSQNGQMMQIKHRHQSGQMVQIQNMMTNGQNLMNDGQNLPQTNQFQNTKMFINHPTRQMHPDASYNAKFVETFQPFSENSDIESIKYLPNFAVYIPSQLGASNFPPKKLMLAWLKVKIYLLCTSLPFNLFLKSISD